LIIKKRQRLLKALVTMLGLLGVLMSLYLIILPLYPIVKFRGQAVLQNLPIAFFDKNEAITDDLWLNNLNLSTNRLIIKKIGVDAPIVDSINGDWALSRGAWHLPKTSTPDKGGNTVLSGHRFKYLPPHNLTFYLFHELAQDDQIYVIWNGKLYHYRVTGIKIVAATDLSILARTATPTLTMFTCEPLFSTEKRLVVTSELVE